MIIDGVKFACEQCVRGHRQAGCNHVDRPLREIAKRGRPITACSKCRELRKASNTHRTCSHHDTTDAPPVLLKSLPNGAKDMQSLALVRRSSSTKSSVSSAPSGASQSHRTPASTLDSSAASASDQELAIVGRKKSLSRPPSVSRRSSLARDKKPHDLAHGHHADHPTHVNSTYSPYPHHAPKEHHHPHPIPHPSPLSQGQPSSAAARKKGSLSPPESFSEQLAPPAQVPTPDLKLPTLPSLAVRIPQRSNSLPTTTASTSTSTAAFAPTPSAAPTAPPALATTTAPAALTTEQLASAYFFRDVPPQRESVGMSLAVSQPAITAPTAVSAPAAVLELPEPDAIQLSPITPVQELDPEALAFVLGPAAQRPANVSLAPMYGVGTTFYSEPESTNSVAADQQAPYAFHGPTSSASVAPGLFASDFSGPSSTASSDIYPFQGHASGSLPPLNPAVYGYPLEPVSSHTLSSYAGSVAPSVSATSALERLNLDFDLDFEHAQQHQQQAFQPRSQNASQPPSQPISSAASASGHGLAPPPPPVGDVPSQTDLEGILEWLASSSTAGAAPPPPPLRADSGASGTSSGVASAWPSAPPSAHGGGADDDPWSFSGPVRVKREDDSHDQGGARRRVEDREGEGEEQESPPAPGPSGASREEYLREGASSPPPAPPPFVGDDEREKKVVLEPPDPRSFVRQVAEEGDGEARAGDGDGDEDAEGELVDEDDGFDPARVKDEDLEMLRTATITCCDSSALDPAHFSSASHSSDEGAYGVGAGSALDDQPYSLADLDLERFGVDEEWFRSLGLAPGQQFPAEGDDEDDDGYEEDDEASALGGAAGDEGVAAAALEYQRSGWTEEDWVYAGPEAEELVVQQEERDRAEQAHDRGGMWWS
ncbi:hypothetical protein Rhopal_006868-T1 [Rhodotorula paludigena]|uniref:Copper-fist domain-containing protein n=1 Tax=Rhodotorula paludigena TaxID=86838 RepID=A0AAV5GWF5_9BASI|nr:hypothetical protein Rhopal_006868-T1 [Rhodotorula paludigena]